MNWQSIRSVTPPCPGKMELKSLMLYARLIPLAKNPPKGAMREAKRAKIRAWNWMGAIVMDVEVVPNCLEGIDIDSQIERERES